MKFWRGPVQKVGEVLGPGQIADKSLEQLIKFGKVADSKQSPRRCGAEEEWDPEVSGVDSKWNSRKFPDGSIFFQKFFNPWEYFIYIYIFFFKKNYFILIFDFL